MNLDWFPDWAGETVIIVASGPSATDVPIEIGKGKARFIAINNSWKLAPWADMLFACDFAWWKNANGCPEWPALKVSIDRRACEVEAWDIKYVHCLRPDDRLHVAERGVIGWGGNSGFHALNLAVQFGCRKIILVGFDMTLQNGEHWHGRHPEGMNNPTAGNVTRWRRAVDNAATVTNALGIKVINSSPISALQSYPKMSLAEALAA